MKTKTARMSGILSCRSRLKSCASKSGAGSVAATSAALDALTVGGRLVVMSYQSLEDRLVKRVLAQAVRSTAPAGLPVELPEHAPQFRLIVKGAEMASDDEKLRNPRATPVRLRADERVKDAA